MWGPPMLTFQWTYWQDAQRGGVLECYSRNRSTSYGTVSRVSSLFIDHFTPSLLMLPACDACLALFDTSYLGLVGTPILKRGLKQVLVFLAAIRPNLVSLEPGRSRERASGIY
jgi:hypothetical protein